MGQKPKMFGATVTENRIIPATLQNMVLVRVQGICSDFAAHLECI